MTTSPELPRSSSRPFGEVVMSTDGGGGEMRRRRADGAPTDEELSLANELVLEGLRARAARHGQLDTQP